MKLTQKVANDTALPRDRSELILFDEDIPGFGLRIGKKRKSWVVQWQQGRRQRRMTIGHTGLCSAVKAREQAQTILARVRLGEDPQAEKFAQRHALTMGDLVEKFVEQKRTRNRAEKTIAEMHRYLAVYAKPLHRFPIDQIDRGRVSHFLDDLTQARSAHVADACRRNLSSFFTFAMRYGYCDANPVLATERPAPPAIRDRVLTPLEIRSIWLATDDESDFAKIVRLLLLTGQRRQEIAALAWSEIDLNTKAIRLPPRRTKNRRPHLVPLSQPALEIIHETAQRPDTEYLFGSSSTPFSGFSKAKKALDLRIAATQGKPLESWRLHDLRRYADTTMRELGVNPWVVEAILNHLPQGVSRHYNFAQFEEERRDALVRLANHVIKLVHADSHASPGHNG